MMDITTIVFSKDRAMQLDFLLRSIRANASCLGRPVVLFKHTNAFYERGYHILASEENGRTGWVHRSEDFDASLKAFLATVKTKYICFLVDDAVFYRLFSLLEEFPEGWAFCPRLGYNTRYCYAAHKFQTSNPPTGDFDVTVSIDGHIYHTAEIMPYLLSKTYRLPNDIEAYLYHEFRPRLAYNVESSLVGIPHNMVGIYPNRAMGGSAEFLNQAFLEGQRIDPAKMDFSNVIGCHQAIPYGYSGVSIIRDRKTAW